MKMFFQSLAARFAARARAAGAAMAIGLAIGLQALSIAPAIPAAPVAGIAVAAVVVSAGPAFAQADPFQNADQKGQQLTSFVFKMLRWGALLGLAAVVALGFMGNLNWSWVFYLALGCVIIAIAPGLIDWMTDNQLTNPNLR